MTMLARRMLSGAPIVCSPRLLGSLLVIQSLSEFVSGDIGPQECRRSTCSRLSTSPASTFAALGQRAPRSLVMERGNRGSTWGAVGVSEFGTDAVPASDVTPEDVLLFWFKDVDFAKNEYPNRLWFMGGEETDKAVREKFGECLELAIQGKLDHWKSTPRGRVALVLVLDQFSRNCYRDTSRSFAQDEAALKIALNSIEQGLDQQLSNPLERSFLYLPLMHCEVPDVHVEALRLFQKLADEHNHNPELHKTLQGFAKAQKGHTAILNKFGRYPSRNALLGRKSTPQEEVYLASGVLWPMED